MTQALTILNGSIPNPASTKFKELPPLSGARDAHTYIQDRLAKGILLNDTPALRGEVSDYAWMIGDDYSMREIAKANSKLAIPTGIPIIDQVMGGLRRKQVTGILGYVGQCKTTILRTMAYNAAAAGFRVLHIPVEAEFCEELNLFGIMHAHAKGTFNLPNITRQRFDDAELTQAELDVLLGEVIPVLAATVGKNLILSELRDDEYTWEFVRSLIERENAKEPLDLVVIDYLTLLGDESDRDDVQRKSAMIKDVKRLTLNTPDYGFAFVTPVQGNRKRYEEAQARDGAWETTGIHLYSSLDKSMDNCLYVYTDDAISATNKIKIGSCKHRRGRNIPATFVDIDGNSGLVGRAKSGSFMVAPVAAMAVEEPVFDLEEFYAWRRPK